MPRTVCRRQTAIAGDISELDLDFEFERILASRRQVIDADRQPPDWTANEDAILSLLYNDDHSICLLAASTESRPGLLTHAFRDNFLEKMIAHR